MFGLAQVRVRNSFQDSVPAALGTPHIISFDCNPLSSSENEVDILMNISTFTLRGRFRIVDGAARTGDNKERLLSVEGEICCSFRMPKNEVGRESTVGKSRLLSSDEFSKLCKTGKEMLNSFAELFQQNFMRSNRRFAILFCSFFIFDF